MSCCVEGSEWYKSPVCTLYLGSYLWKTGHMEWIIYLWFSTILVWNKSRSLKSQRWPFLAVYIQQGQFSDTHTHIPANLPRNVSCHFYSEVWPSHTPLHIGASKPYKQSCLDTHILSIFSNNLLLYNINARKYGSITLQRQQTVTLSCMESLA